MDGDPAVEPEVDSFSLVLPLPFRVAIILVLGTQIEIVCHVADSSRCMGLGLELALLACCQNCSFAKSCPCACTDHYRTYHHSFATLNDPRRTILHTTTPPTDWQRSSLCLWSSVCSSSGFSPMAIEPLCWAGKEYHNYTSFSWYCVSRFRYTACQGQEDRDSSRLSVASA
jgi:hypothetical protein